jgi:homoserine kinase
MSCSSALIRVPASTSNLGPGFDCLGLALNLYNTTHVQRVDKALPQRGMIAETAAAFFKQAAGRPVETFPIEVRIEGAIPVSRGLGSSVTVRLGVLMGLAELVREVVPVSREDILRLLIELEGHPDNAVPSFLGGFAVCAPASDNPKDGFGFTRCEVKPGLSFVTLVPELRLSTKTARGLLPPEVPFRHAVENAQRVARITSLFCTGDYPALRGLFVDHLHQPFRQVLIPGFADILGAAREAGALGSFLSGAGSSLMALTLDKVEEVSHAMLETARKHDLPGRVLVLQADNAGALVLETA